jgi:SAM-dependent methyltransferase
MLERARVATERTRGTSRVELVRGDVLEPDPAWGRFELATSFGAFGHILERDEPRFVRAVRTLLVPGGRFVFVTTDGPPPITSPSYWFARGFNAAMRVRNAILRPPFVMYYLTFMLPRARALLESEGFTITVTRSLFAPPLDRYVRVVATLTRA